MKKHWTIGNGWKKTNTFGQLEDLQISATDFDPDYDQPDRPYREMRDPNGGGIRGWRFRSKRERDGAASRLSKEGFSS